MVNKDINIYHSQKKPIVGFLWYSFMAGSKILDCYFWVALQLSG